MAVHIHQTPMNNPHGYIQMLTGTIYPLYSTFTYNTTDPIYGDFKYVTDLETEDGVVNSFSSVGEDGENWGKLSVSNYIKNYITNVFQPKANSIIANPNAILNYKLTVTPFNNNTLITADKSETLTMFGIKASQMEYDLSYFLDGVNDKMLVDVPLHTYSLNTYATNKALYGHFGYSYGSIFESIFNRVLYYLIKPDGTQLLFELENLLPIYSPTSNSYLDNTDNMLVEIPVGPANLASTWFTLLEVRLPSGYVYYPNLHTQIHLVDGDRVCYAAFNNATQVSKQYCINVQKCSTRYTPVDISWLTETGAYDTFTTYAKSEKSVKVKNTTYTKTPYTRDDNYNYYQQKTTDAGETVYTQDIEEDYELNTDWLTESEIAELEELWTSPDVYIQLGSNHYPVISTIKSAVIKNNKTPGVFKYKITVRLATKKYRI